VQKAAAIIIAKRWGKFIDKRNWKSYNEELVRGEFLLPIDMFDSWIKN